MTTQVALRNSQPSDEDFLRRLFADSHPELSSLPLPPPTLDQLLQLQRQAQLSQYQARYPNAVDQVIEVAGRPVGRCWTDLGTDEHRLLDIAVLRTEQGRGIGRTVLSGLCEQAGRAGVPLRLTVWSDNAGARRLYTSLGFILEAEAEGYLSMCWTATAAPASSDEQGSVMPEQPMTYEVFSDRLNQRFTMRVADQDIEVILTECRASQVEGGPASFSLTFKAGPDAPIEQSTYLLSAEGFGPAPIFLVPVRKLPDGLEYQAVFTN